MDIQILKRILALILQWQLFLLAESQCRADMAFTWFAHVGVDVYISLLTVGISHSKHSTTDTMSFLHTYYRGFKASHSFK